MNIQCYTISNIYNGKTKRYFLLTYLKAVCVKTVEKTSSINIDIRDKLALHYVYVFMTKKNERVTAKYLFYNIDIFLYVLFKSNKKCYNKKNTKI